MVIERSWRSVAAQLLSDDAARWNHVRTVAGRAAYFTSRVRTTESELLVDACWLHNIGYAASVRETGFHPLDGAQYLKRLGAPSELLGLVAFHSGAEWEAEERELGRELELFERPDARSLDIVTWCDMTVSPAGVVVNVNERIIEILNRYPRSHPVHRAVSRSQSYLRGSVVRVEGLLYQPI